MGHGQGRQAGRGESSLCGRSLTQGDSYLIFFRIPAERVGALKYHILVGGCVPGARKITVTGWSRYFYTVVAAGTTGRTRAFGVEGVNRAGTGPCVEVMTTGLPD